MEEYRAMEKVIHRSGSRGFTDNGWVQTYHTFSFANYYDPRRINFGALRVLNNDTIEGNEGFGSHHHDNMEIITIPIEGSFDHGDNIGNITTVSAGEAQIMSAGTGLVHNVYNHSKEQPLKYVLIWIFPQEYELPPSQSVVKLVEVAKNEWQPVVSPVGGERILKINQNAWIYMNRLEAGASVEYCLNDPNNGVYLFVLEGDVAVDESSLHACDAIGIVRADRFSIEAQREARILLIEIPMNRWSNTTE